MQTKPITKSRTGSRAVATSLSAPKPVPTVKAAPSHDDIAQRAYEIYVARGQENGHEMEDWIQAERELLEKSHRNN